MFDRYENRPRHEDGLLEGFEALYYYVYEGNGTRVLVDQVPLRELPLQFFGRELTFWEPSAWEPGLVGANATLTRTGVYEVTVLHRQGIVNGTPFNITVVAGPPDPGQTTIQVRWLHACQAACVFLVRAACQAIGPAPGPIRAAHTRCRPLPY